MADWLLTRYREAANALIARQVYAASMDGSPMDYRSAGMWGRSLIGHFQFADLFHWPVKMYIYSVDEPRAKGRVIELEPAYVPATLHLNHQKTAIGHARIQGYTAQNSELFDGFLAIVASQIGGRPIR
jgi:hypothetical protein